MTPDAFLFHVDEVPLVGIIHPGAQQARTGVLIIVGGPQYRVGSHRQFLLLARHLSAQGIPVMRFDYRGMGDAGGDQRDFEHIDEDIESAIDAFQSRMPHLERVVIWGLCDAASAALMYAWRDPRVAGLVLLNPWVRTEQGLAKAYLKHYYVKRMFSRDFWSGVFSGRFNPLTSLRSLADLVRRTVARPPQSSRNSDARSSRAAALQGELPERMASGWQRFEGRILLILSGDDLTAAEFRDVAAGSRAWSGLLSESRVTLHEMDQANHTFSRREWRDDVSRATLAWVKQVDSSRDADW
ncbi:MULTISPECIES: hydrolase 1, exosortase A system-associated [unclassified Ectothiorhodospira]|uniref:hydrolase 1, exosortase A system-associated n=1 Tax=unclassified Ectothiorhodospira TaxID=2684909 RepID=UPI001EE8DE15|nr:MULTISPECIES: hydrolase 1, exosortase A system-associated [unclassified Ectothiorhodospira]MCG5517090.1 hydrolase 1, exosortase A system-associated [Ectothiorhodospira sp. 9100]MCG5519752.1 hydrolase 1, exosortase A system-associated [Ectothiorhodospira sp. 9905]